MHLRETLLEQIEWCKQRKMKKQKETLLLVLQVASARDAGVRGVECGGEGESEGEREGERERAGARAPTDA